jgi:ABC-type transport system involved in multi-copper enzyme maturation permease subunit
MLLPLTRLYLLGSLRRQVHLATLFLGLVLFIMPAYVNAFSLGGSVFERVSKDFGLTLIAYFAIAMAVVLGSTSVPSDVEARSVYPVLARPISRAGFLAAHFLSVVAMLGGSVLFLGLCMSTSLSVIMRQVDPTLLPGLYGSFLQAAVVGGVCLLFSVRFSPSLAGSVGVLVYLAGSLSKDFLGLWLPDQMSRAAGALKAMLPDLSALALKDAVVNHAAIPPEYLLFMTVYSVGWMGLTLILAYIAFQEVDL